MALSKADKEIIINTVLWFTVYSETYLNSIDENHLLDIYSRLSLGEGERNE